MVAKTVHRRNQQSTSPLKYHIYEDLLKPFPAKWYVSEILQNKDRVIRIQALYYKISILSKNYAPGSEFLYFLKKF